MTQQEGREAANFGNGAPTKPASWGEEEQTERCRLRAMLARSCGAQFVTTRPEVPGLGRLPNKHFCAPIGA